MFGSDATHDMDIPNKKPPINPVAVDALFLHTSLAWKFNQKGVKWVF